jgi:hypothetical protein
MISSRLTPALPETPELLASKEKRWMGKVVSIGGAAIIIAGFIILFVTSYFSPLERCVREQVNPLRTDDAVARSLCTRKPSTDSD